MSQNDLLDSEPHNDNRTTEEVENGNFSILIPSIILDRFSYYGFRSLIVLYVVMEFEFDRMQALSQYGLFTMLIYIMAVPGGALGDFVFKSKQSLIIGSIVMNTIVVVFLWQPTVLWPIPLYVAVLMVFIFRNSNFCE